jgi:hypothetical protein
MATRLPRLAGFLRRVKPAETLQGNVVFDVPPKHYRLRVGDENSQKHAISISRSALAIGYPPRFHAGAIMGSHDGK